MYRRHGGYGEITKREIMVSIIIIFLVISLGVVIVSKVENTMEEINEIYYKALKIDNDESMYHHAKRTDAGAALVYTDVKAVDTVTFPEISGDFMNISKIREEYTRHTRTVTTRNSNGTTSTRTEVYYTWDYRGTETKDNKEIEIFSDKYSSSKFDFSAVTNRLKVKSDNFVSVDGLRLNSNGYVYKGSNTRYYYNHVPTEIKSNFLLNFEGKDIKPSVSKQIELKYGTIEERLEQLEKSVGRTKILITIVIVILTIIGLVKFVSGHHYWLESGR